MTDPGLKLPLKIIGGIGNHTRMVTDTTGRILVDIRGEPVRAQRRAEVIVAALTADAKFDPCHCPDCTKPDAEKEVQGG